MLRIECITHELVCCEIATCYFPFLANIVIIVIIVWLRSLKGRSIEQMSDLLKGV